VLLPDANGLNLVLGFWPDLSSDPHLVTVRQDVYLDIRCETDDTLEDYMQALKRFQNFLSLATGSLVWPESIKGIVRTEEAGTGGSPIFVDLLYQPAGNITRPNLVRPKEALFTLPEIAGREAECFNNWFAKAAWLDPVYDLYFGTLYNPSTYLDLNFLTLAQALEAYHRRSSSETDKPPNEHEERMKVVLEAVPTEHREWLNKQLEYSNELSFRRRLKKLFAQFSYVLDELVPDRNGTIDAICTSRNYLTHYDQKLKPREATGAKLLYLVEVLKVVLQCCFLKELGLPDDAVKEFVFRSRSVRMIRHLQKPRSLERPAQG